MARTGTASSTASCVRESVGQLSAGRQTDVSRSWRLQQTSPGSGQNTEQVTSYHEIIFLCIKRTRWVRLNKILRSEHRNIRNSSVKLSWCGEWIDG